MRAGPRLNDRWLAVIPLAAALIAYAPAPMGDLVWDDHNFFREMGLFTTLRHLFEPPAGFFTPRLYFRPVYYLSYLVDHRIWGAESIAGPHITNLVLHLAVVLLVFLLIRSLLIERPAGNLAAVLGATLFAVHPLHTENVNWISGRADMIAALLLVAGFLLLVSARNRRSPTMLVAAAMVLGLAVLSKEVAVAGLVIGPALMLLTRRPDSGPMPIATTGRGKVDWQWVGTSTALSIILALAYFRLRAEFGAGYDPTDANLVPERLLVLLKVGGWYLLRLVYPGPPTIVVAPNMLPAIGTAVALGAAAALLLAWAIRRYRLASDGIPLLGIWWAGVTIAPALVIPLTDLVPTVVASLVAERYLYVTSIGVAILIADVLTLPQPGRWRYMAAGACAAAAVLSLGVSLQRSIVWLNEIRVWEAVVRQAPNDGLPWFQLGRARQRANDPAGAEADYLRGLEVPATPFNRATALYNLGNLALRRDDVEAAEAHFRASLWEAPGYGLAFYGLGDVYHRKGLRADNLTTRLRWFDRSRGAYDSASRFSPGASELGLQVVRLLADRSVALALAGRTAEALADRDRASSLLGNLMERFPEVGSNPALQALHSELNRSGSPPPPPE